MGATGPTGTVTGRVVDWAGAPAAAVWRERAWSVARTAVEPVRSTDLKGHDVTDRLRFWDRSSVDGFRKLSGWTGYAEEHGIILDFGERLSGSSWIGVLLLLSGILIITFGKKKMIF